MLRAINNADFAQVKQLIAEHDEKGIDYFLLLEDAIRVLKQNEEQDTFLSNPRAIFFFSLNKRLQKVQAIDALVDIIYLLIDQCLEQTATLIPFINEHHLFNLLAYITATKMDFPQKKSLLLTLLSKEGIRLTKENGSIRLLSYAIAKQDPELIAQVILAITDDTLTIPVDYFGRKTFVALFKEPWTKTLPADIKQAAAICLIQANRSDLAQESGLAKSIDNFYPNSPYSAPGI